MKQASRIILIAIAAVAVLTMPATNFAKGPSALERGFHAAQPASTTSQFDGTHPMPPGFDGTHPMPPGFDGTHPMPPGFLS